MRSRLPRICWILALIGPHCAGWPLNNTKKLLLSQPARRAFACWRSISACCLLAASSNRRICSARAGSAAPRSNAASWASSRRADSGFAAACGAGCGTAEPAGERQSRVTAGRRERAARTSNSSQSPSPVRLETRRHLSVASLMPKWCPKFGHRLSAPSRIGGSGLFRACCDRRAGSPRFGQQVPQHAADDQAGAGEHEARRAPLRRTSSRPAQSAGCAGNRAAPPRWRRRSGTHWSGSSARSAPRRRARASGSNGRRRAGSTNSDGPPVAATTVGQASAIGSCISVHPEDDRERADAVGELSW